MFSSLLAPQFSIAFLVPFLSILLLPYASALKFDLPAHTGHGQKYERCIRNFVARDTLVLVTAIVGGNKGEGQMVNMHVRVCARVRPHSL